MSCWGRAALCSAVAAGVLAVGAANAADMPVKAPIAPAAVAWINPFAGFAIAPHSYFGDAGAVVAINGNIGTPGWLLRVRGGAGHYDYNRTTALSQGVNFQTGEIMVGYQTFLGAARVTGYVGANVERHDNSDPLAVVTGTRAGAKVQGEILAPLNQNLYLFALGTYSTVWNSYFTMGKLGYRVADRVTIGPEAAAFGNDRFDRVRTGPFVAFDLTSATQVILSGGYAWDTRRNSLNDHSGAFGTIHVRGVY